MQLTSWQAASVFKMPDAALLIGQGTWTAYSTAKLQYMVCCDLFVSYCVLTGEYKVLMQ